MEPSAILLASPPRDSAFQMVSGILEPSGSMSPTGQSGSRKPTHGGLASTGILEVGPDPDGGWVIEGGEGPRASKRHRLICE